MLRIENGEETSTSTAHITEIANILEARMGHQIANTAIQSILNIQSLTVHPVTVSQMKGASLISITLGLGFNDTLAYLVMKEHSIEEIYSFDKAFETLQDIRRIHE